ncbi:class I SAM-dependent methyltransferase [Antrihabitans sp. YC2-6]|uniref:class I SAM-dependent methyltransferase n=1 Tax=Antrihabitans sp. YC2-6 TaxID=2799498 RepID=UPI0018F5976C|nr:class I SAM-dependent methyltransferase [Antrihabitans sp. YC2-6]MBJ8348703.1 class I SAM-dependent methyltransferase [Antrihabitans sp. YC2-6]
MASRYRSVVDASLTNNAHSYALQMIGGGQRVLELGAAAGDVTRALVDQRCEVTAVEYDEGNRADLEVAAHRVVIGDLNDPHIFDELSGPFDVVLAGDVLEHLLYPDAVLRRVAPLLAPGGRIVVSLPNVAHVDVRLTLLEGRFDYLTLGLLDRTHIRFFTRKTVGELVSDAGYTITEMRKVRVPAFHTELLAPRGTVPQEVLDKILADPDAETYQFVFSAVRKDQDVDTEQIVEKYVELREKYDRMVELQRVTQFQLSAIQASKTLRYTEKPRAVYRAIRAAVQKSS